MQVFVRATPQEREYSIEGDFTVADEDAFFDVFSAIRSQTEGRVVFNLKKCTFIDSAATGMLLVAYEEAAKRHMTQVIRNVPDAVRAELTLAGIDRYYRFQSEK